MIGKAFEKLEMSFNEFKGKRMPGYYPENKSNKPQAQPQEAVAQQQEAAA